MSGERKSGWGAEAEGLANRYAIASGVAVTFILFGLIVIPAIVGHRRRICPVARISGNVNVHELRTAQAIAVTAGLVAQMLATPPEGKPQRQQIRQVFAAPDACHPR